MFKLNGLGGGGLFGRLCLLLFWEVGATFSHQQDLYGISSLLSQPAHFKLQQCDIKQTPGKGTKTSGGLGEFRGKGTEMYVTTCLLDQKL